MRGSSSASLVTTIVPRRLSRSPPVVALDSEATSIRDSAALGTARTSTASVSDLSSNVAGRSAASMRQLPGRHRILSYGVERRLLVRHQLAGGPDQPH